MTALLPPSGARRIKKPETPNTLSGSGPATIRLNKRMAELGICSRREADEDRQRLGSCERQAGRDGAACFAQRPY
jgi:hypothetical protein